MGFTTYRGSKNRFNGLVKKEKTEQVEKRMGAK